MKRKMLLGFAAAIVVTIALGCAGRIPVTNDIASPMYHKAGVDFSAYDTAVFDFVEVTTTNGKGVEDVRSMTKQSLETWLQQSGMFDSVKNNKEGAAGRVLYIKANAKVHWGSRAARYLVGFGAGKAHIWLNYYVYEMGSDELLAKMEAHDTMSVGAFGGGAKRLVYAGAEKWNKFFVYSILSQ